MPDRFCPWCGSGNPAEYVFCPKCGRTLPTVDAGSAPDELASLSAFLVEPSPVATTTSAGPPGASAPFVPTTDSLLADTFERPLTDDERRKLKQVGQIPRIVASVIGFVALTTGLVGVIGPVADPSFFSMFTLAMATFAIATSAAARVLRRGAALALARGSVTDAYGVPVRPANDGLGSLDVGATRFSARRPGTMTLPANRILEGRLNRLSYVRDASAGGALRAWILAVNGTVLGRPAACRLAEASVDAVEASA